MPYEKFRILESSGVPLEIENVDTDQIIPARFLKATERIDFDKNLFRDWRYNQDNTPKENFVLNNKIYSGKVLVAGKNFGSGSSREHAVWAIYDYGFRCVISSFFADIFRANALNNGLLPIKVSEKNLIILMKTIKAFPDTEITVNLEEQTIRVEASNIKETFEIDPYKKMCLINGYDDIDFLVSKKETIIQFEKQHSL